MGMVVARALERRCQLVLADRAVAVGVELGEHAVGSLHIGAAGAEIGLELGFADLAVAIVVEQREQTLQRIGRALRRLGLSRILALRREQRRIGFRRQRAAGTRGAGGGRR